MEAESVHNNRGRFKLSKRLVILIILIFLNSFYGFAEDSFVFRITIGEEYYNIVFKSESEIRESSSLHLTNNFWIYFSFLSGAAAFLILFFNLKKTAAVFIIFSVFILLGASDPFPSINITNGFNNLKNGHYNDALNDFKTADEILPHNPALKYNLALCYYLTEDRSEAICNLRRSIILDPQAEEPRRVLGIIEQKLELTNQIRPGIKLHPDIPFIFFIIFINLTLILLGLVYRYKKGVLFIFFVFFAFISSFALGTYIYSLAELDGRVGIVINDEGVLKKIPMDIANAWMSFKQGTSLKISGLADGYWLVKSQLGFEGFIHESDLLIVYDKNP